MHCASALQDHRDAAQEAIKNVQEEEEEAAALAAVAKYALSVRTCISAPCVRSGVCIAMSIWPG